MSKLVEALEEGLNLGKSGTLRYDPDTLPPVCTMEDMVAIGDLLRQFNGSDKFVEVYGCASTSRSYIDGSEKNPKWRLNHAIKIRIVGNVEQGRMIYMRRFKPGYLRSVQLALANGTGMPKFDVGKLYPLACDGVCFGVLLVTDRQYNPYYPRPQFGIVMNVLRTPETEDVEKFTERLLEQIVAKQRS